MPTILLHSLSHMISNRNICYVKMKNLEIRMTQPQTIILMIAPIITVTPQPERNSQGPRFGRAMA